LGRPACPPPPLGGFCAPFGAERLTIDSVGLSVGVAVLGISLEVVAVMIPLMQGALVFLSSGVQSAVTVSVPVSAAVGVSSAKLITVGSGFLAALIAAAAPKNSSSSNANTAMPATIIPRQVGP
jgi:hypothetical protein